MSRTLEVLVVAALLLDVRPAEGDAKRDAGLPYPGLELLHIGNFGPVARLPAHPAFAHLGLTPQQTVGLVGALLHNGLLSPTALRLPNGHLAPFIPHCNPPPIDPYFLLLMANYGRFLPFGLGPQGFYGTTGLPKTVPFPVLRYNDKN